MEAEADLADLHPVIEKYSGADRDLLAILREEPEPRSQLIEAMTALRESLGGLRTPDEALQAAASVPDGEHDPNLYLLFLGLWAYVSLQSSRMEQAAALVRRGQALVTPEVLPELQTTLLSVEGILFSYRGDKAGREECQRRELELLPADSPKRNVALSDRTLFLAQMGRLAEGAEDLVILECNAAKFPRNTERIALARLVNATETGAMDEADSLLEEVVGNKASAVMQVRTVTGVAEVLAKLMKGALAASEHWTFVEGGEEVEEGPPNWALSTLALQRGDREEALRLAREHVAENPGVFLGAGFSTGALLRAELAAGNAGAALRLLSLYRIKGARHYLDDLYYTRVELLCGNFEAAAGHFATLLDAVERYGADGRLDFELQLALELSPGDLVKLSRAAAAELSAKPREGPLASEPKTVPRRDLRGSGRLAGPSAELGKVRELVAKMAPTDAPVLINGETGTGKELVAHAIHEESSRSEKPFLAVNCGAIAEGLLESELFGHERGAFTGASRARKGIFEEAGEGTVFLDEIGEVSSRIQVALLRVLEAGEVRPVGGSRDRKVSCRVVAATNADVDALAASGDFRQDLLYRLKRLVIEIPPLRERPGDILPLADLFLSEGRHGEGRPVMADDFKRVLSNHSWPGNVRELRNVIERVRLLNSDKLSYEAADLEGSISAKHGRDAAPPANREKGKPADEGKKARAVIDAGRTEMRRLERLRELFVEHGQLTRSEVARILSISPTTATKDLKALCAEGLIEKVEPSRSPRSHYFRLKTED